MFFVLSKIFLFLIAPITWIVILLLLGVFTKNHSRKKRFFIASLLLILFFSNTFLFDRFMNAWEVAAIPEHSLGHFDAVILLTGMATYDPQNERLEFNDRTDRLMQAINLIKDGKADKIILCGGPATVSGSDSLETGLIKNYLEKLGIGDSNIFLETKSRNTHQNAEMLKPILEKKLPAGKFLLVSSAWHLRRATACFHKSGIKVVPYSTDRFSGPVKYDIDYLLFPSSATLFNWEKLFHEWIGCITYSVLGYI